jgi:triacylglycerol lipase
MASEADIRDFLLRVQPSNAVAVAFLQLCEVAYLPQDQIKPTLEDPNALPPITPGGRWQCVWGPAEDDDTANLAFVALYYADPRAAPLFAAATIRGTDVHIQDAWGIVREFWEDLDVIDRQALPWAPTDPARIAGGTWDALQAFQALTSNGQTLLDGLSSLVRATAGLPLAVVGHSLGGCMATVVAPWLHHELGTIGVPITPVTFAAPTAGNPAFVASYQQKFPNAPRYWSSLDIVPRGWDAIGSVKTLYAPCNLDCPDIVRTAIDGYELALRAADIAYAQPDSAAIALAGGCAKPVTDWDWYDEAGFHHHATTYMRLLGGSDVVGMPMWKPAALRGLGARRIGQPTG